MIMPDTGEKRLLDRRTALVTGGTRGIGRAIAQRLAAEGAQVIVTGRTEHDRAPEGCRYQGIDFESAEKTEIFSRKVAEWKVDILVNNAGINKIGPFDELAYTDFKTIQQVNVHVPFLVCQSVLPHMKKQKWGRIVNISSIFGKVSKALRSPYSASKFALDGMTVALAAEVASFGILANCVAPGFIDTDLTRRILGESGIKELTSQIPIGRLGKPDEIAGFVTWLCSSENTYISGQNIAIDGGFTRV